MLFKNMGLRVQNNFEHCIMPNEITFCDWRMNDINWDWDTSSGRPAGRLCLTCEPTIGRCWWSVGNLLVVQLSSHLAFASMPFFFALCDARSVSGLLKHVRLNKCYGATDTDDVPTLLDCDAADANQQWELQPFSLQGGRCSLCFLEY